MRMSLDDAMSIAFAKEQDRIKLEALEDEYRKIKWKSDDFSIAKKRLIMEEMDYLVRKNDC